MVKQSAYKTLVDTQTLASHLDDPQWRIFDCRFRLSDPDAGRREYEKNHIPGAVYVDLEKDLTGPIDETTGRHPLPDPAGFKEKLSRWGVTPEHQVVVYDDSFGSVAARLWWMLFWIGLDNAAMLDGGLAAWQREKRPMNTEVPVIQPAPPFEAQHRDDMWISSDEVMAALDNGNIHLIDARAEPRFLGLEEPFDKIAGHIPGAVNVPYEDNLDLDGTYLSADEIREVYKEAGAGDRAADILLMCGSGVTACHTVLAMEHAGMGMPRLYAGSWSEWIQDENRPKVVKG